MTEVNNNVKKIAPMLFCVLTVAAFILVLVVPASRWVFKDVTTGHPFMMGFIKFALLATVGELIAIRLTVKSWIFPAGFAIRACIWGFLGIVITLVFRIFTGGVLYAFETGLILNLSNRLWGAFLCSMLMNTIFAPTMMIFHRITDTAITMKYDDQKILPVANIVQNIDFKPLIGFTIARTIPCFWIPAHTISFMLPPEYQIIMAASLSIALGIILSLKKK